MNNANEVFKSLNFDTKPTSVKMDVATVEVHPEFMIADFAKAYVRELTRRNPIRYQASGLTVEDLDAYFQALVVMRVQSINDAFPRWREAKLLNVPAWIEFVLTCVGEVMDTDRGLHIKVTCDQTYDFAKALDVSEKLRAFKADGVVLLKDVFPRTAEGDVETMTMAIIDNYVCSQTKEAHPIASYVAAYLGFKLQEEVSFKMLYRVRYDDVDYIRTQLLQSEEVVG